MKKLTYGELCAAFRAAERENPARHIAGAIVFTEDSFREPYSLESRTYILNSDNKAYKPNMGGYSIYGSAKDGSDPLVGLECYMTAEKGGKDGWKVEYCYLTDENGEAIDG